MFKPGKKKKGFDLFIVFLLVLSVAFVTEVVSLVIGYTEDEGYWINGTEASNINVSYNQDINVTNIDALGNISIRGTSTDCGKLNITNNLVTCGVDMNDGGSAETDPTWQSNLTNMLEDAIADNYVYGIYGNGSWKIREDQTGGGEISNTSLNLLYLNLSGTNANQDINISPYNLSANYGFFEYIGVNQPMPLHNLDIIGDVLLTHTATGTDEHGLELKIDASGFGDVKGIDILYDTGAISTGQDEEAILINIDEFEATGGDVIGLEVIATEGSAEIYGLGAGVLVNPVVQLSGIFGDMDSALNNTIDVLSAFTSTTTDVHIFVNDNDYVTIGNADKFEEIEFILDTTANINIKPIFYYSTGVGTWGEFTPADGTNGLENNGVMIWLDEDIPSWATGTGGEYLIRINRTRNNLVTVPKEDKVQISSATKYFWDERAYLFVKNITAEDNITAFAFNGKFNFTVTPNDFGTFDGSKITLTNQSTDIQAWGLSQFVESNNVGENLTAHNLTVMGDTSLKNVTFEPGSTLLIGNNEAPFCSVADFDACNYFISPDDPRYSWTDRKADEIFSLSASGNMLVNISHNASFGWGVDYGFEDWYGLVVPSNYPAFSSRAAKKAGLGFGTTGGNRFYYTDNTGLEIMNISLGGEIKAKGVSFDGTGKVVCIKSNHELGTCTSGVGAGGTCTCA